MGAVYLAYPRLASHGCLSPSGLALASSLIMRQHLARYLLRSPGNDRLNGVIAHVFTGDVIDGPEPPPVMLDFQAHFGASVFRCPALLSSLHPAQLAGLLFVHGHPACGHTHRASTLMVLWPMLILPIRPVVPI